MRSFQALQAELDGQRSTVAELREALAGGGGSRGGRASLTNKKDEDSYDVEAAVLTGGSAAGFQPLAGARKPWTSWY